MTKHIRILAYLVMIYGGTSLVFALANMIDLNYFTESLAIYGNQVHFASYQDSNIITTIIKVLTFIETYLALIIGIPAMIGGYGLYYHKSWGRYTLLLVSILLLIKLPVGTMIGLYSIWVLTRPDSVRVLHTAEAV